MKIKLFILFLATFVWLSAFAQQINTDSLVFIPSFLATYTYDFVDGDMANRFGNNSEIGLECWVKTDKNWTIGLSYSFLFGNHIKEDSLLKGLENSSGEIIGEDGQYAEIRVFERGYKFPVLKIGRVFSLPLSKNSSVNSGIIFLAGVGFMQHKIRYDIISRNVPQLRDDYVKGYDRLTNGLILTQNLGYIFYSKNNLTNFYIGAEITEGFTKVRRSYDFASKSKLDDSRLDLLYGIKVAWIFTLRKKLATGYYYH